MKARRSVIDGLLIINQINYKVILMSEVPTLRQLAEGLDPIMPDVDIATALIATTEPKKLDQARAKAYRNAGLGNLMRPKITLEAEEAEAELDRVTLEPSSDESKKEARERLERLLAEEVGASQIEHEDQIELSLAHAIGRKRTYLARPLRWAAELTCALVIAPTAGFTYLVETASDNQAHSKNNPTHVQPANGKVELSTPEEVVGILFTGAFVFIGGFAGYIATDGRKLDRAYARRQAKKILKKSQRY